MLPGVSSSATGFIASTGDGTTAYQLWQLQKKKGDIRREYLDYWESTIQISGTGRPVDAIISPVAPFAAPPHGMNRSVRFIVLSWFSFLPAHRRGRTGTLRTHRFGTD